MAYLALSEFVTNPNSAVTLFLSLFPLTSTIVMPTRLVIGAVPIWQLIVALLLLVLAVWLVVRGAANLFSSQNLLSGQKFNLKTFFSTLLFGKKSQKA